MHVVIGDELDWTVVLGGSLATRMLRGASAMMPRSMWTDDRALAGMGAVVGPMLRAGRVRLHGRTPNGQRFQVAPDLVWPVVSSTATWRGIELGEPGRLRPQAHMADLWMPQRGLFYVGSAVFESLDPARHTQPATASPSGV